MINANNSNSIQIIPAANRKFSNSVMDSSLTKKKKKTDNADTSNTKLGHSDKSTNKSLSSSDVKAEMQIKKEITKSPNNKLTRNKTVAVGEANKKNRVKFKKDFVSTVVVESYKKYNVDMSYNDTETNESTKCRCLIF